MAADSSILKRLQRLKLPGRSRPSSSLGSATSERRSSDRHDINSPAVLIEVSEKRAYVLGVEWTQHLTGEGIAVAATKKAKSLGCSHVYLQSQGEDSFGVVNIDAADAKQYKELVPMAACFAQSVPDKNSRSIFLLDMRNEDEEGMVYFAVTFKGIAQKEILCPGDSALGLLARLMNESSSGANIFLDTPFNDFFTQVASIYPTTIDFPQAKIVADVGFIQTARLLSISNLQLGMIVVVILAGLAYYYGADYYQRNLQAQSIQEQQAAIRANYIAQRNQTFNVGFASTAENAIAGVLATVKPMPLFRNGWEFDQAVCVVDQPTCQFKWSRVYGTNETFLESAKPEDVQLDPQNYKSLTEVRPLAVEKMGKPEFPALPLIGDFIRVNGDRTDTLALAEITTFVTDKLLDLLPWTGTGAAPNPEIVVADWRLEAPVEQVEEIIANKRLGIEFSINKITVTNKAGAITLSIEGKVYARKS